MWCEARSCRGAGRVSFAKKQYRDLATILDFALIGGMMEHGDRYEESIPALLKELADKSGHPEIEHIPLITMGFSNGGWWAVNVAKVMPERTIAVAVAGMPGLSDVDKKPEHLAAMRTVPVCQVNGASDGATHDWFRKQNPTFPKLREGQLPWTLAQQWNTKHTYGATNALAFPFLREAISIRLPADADARKGPVPLKPIDPEKTWVGDSRTWSKGFADIRVANEEALADPKMVWLLNEAVAHSWRSFLSLHRVKQTVVIEQNEDGSHQLRLKGDLRKVRAVRYFSSATLLAEPAVGEYTTRVAFDRGIYSVFAELSFEDENKKVTAPVLLLVKEEASTHKQASQP